MNSGLENDETFNKLLPSLIVIAFLSILSIINPLLLGLPIKIDKRNKLSEIDL